MICGSHTKGWGLKVHYEILKCLRCGFGYVYPRPEANFLKRFYTERNHSDVNPAKVARHRLEIPPWKEGQLIHRILLPLGIESGSLLDVGGGFGRISEYFHARGFAVSTVEPDPHCVQELRKRIPSVNIIRETWEDWNPDDRTPRSFDVIIMSQVVEHILQPVSFVAKSVSLLKPGGILVLSTPNFHSLLIKILGVREGHICPPEHLNFFTMKSLRILGELCELSLVRSFTRNSLTWRLASEGWREYVRVGVLKQRGISDLAGALTKFILGAAQPVGLGRYLYAFYKSFPQSV